MHKFFARCTGFGEVVLQSSQAIWKFIDATHNLRASTTTEGDTTWATNTRSSAFNASADSALVIVFSKGAPTGALRFFRGRQLDTSA
jgi:hypothetical protein